jgi:hypothetical protein
MGWFGAVFAKLLVAQRAFIEELEAQVITLKHPGLIQSDNFVAGNRGFQIKADGDVEFNSGTFRGELAAKYIKVTGTVSSGTQHLLKADYSYLPATYNAPLVGSESSIISKTFNVSAKGSCLIRLKFIDTGSLLFGTGAYRIRVNNSIYQDWSSTLLLPTPEYIDIPNIPLVNNINIITLDYTARLDVISGWNVSDMNISLVNTVFELRCTEDPGLLALLG